MDFFEMRKKEDEVFKMAVEKTGEDPVEKMDRLLELQKRQIEPIISNLKIQLQESKVEDNQNIEVINEKLEILEKDFFDLNGDEVQKIGMLDEYDIILYMVCAMIAKYTPGNEKGEKMYFYKYKDAKKISNDDININTFIEFFKRYVHMTYDEVLDDIKKIRKGKHI